MLDHTLSSYSLSLLPPSGGMVGWLYSFHKTTFQQSRILLSTDQNPQYSQTGLFRLLQVQITLSETELGYELSARVSDTFIICAGHILVFYFWSCASRSRSPLALPPPVSWQSHMLCREKKREHSLVIHPSCKCTDCGVTFISGLPMLLF